MDGRHDPLTFDEDCTQLSRWLLRITHMERTSMRLFHHPRFKLNAVTAI